MQFGPRERELSVTIDMPEAIQRLKAWQPGEHNITWLIAQMLGNTDCQTSYTHGIYMLTPSARQCTYMLV